MKSKHDKFYDFLSSSYSNASEREAELKADGIDVTRVNKAVAAMLARQAIQSTATSGARVEAPSWLDRAKKAQSGFEAKVKAKSSWLSQQYKTAKELAAAVADGGLGLPVQQHAAVFFRDRDMKDVSEQDLRTFLDDCELLGLIENDEKNGRGKRS